MSRQPTYGISLVSTIVAGIVAGFVMVLPSWLWSHYVLNVGYDAIVGRGEGLSTGDRILLYGGNLALVFLGYAVYAWLTRSLYRAFQDVDPPYWDTFAALVATGILAAIVGYFLPFVGMLIVIFVAPAFVNGSTATGVDIRGRAPRDVDPYTHQRTASPRAPRG